jgi:hypothetical protein
MCIVAQTGALRGDCPISGVYWSQLQSEWDEMS